MRENIHHLIDVHDRGSGGDRLGGHGQQITMPLHDGSCQLGVRAMPRADSDDMAPQWPTRQSQIADDIEDLVTDKFVGESQRFLAENGVAADHEGILKAPPFDQTFLHQILHILVVDKSAGGGDVTRKDFGSDFQGKVLGETPIGTDLGAGDAKSVVRKE